MTDDDNRDLLAELRAAFNEPLPPPLRKCENNGGTGIGAGHTCRCNRHAEHPLDSDRPHVCPCGAMWADTRHTTEPLADKLARIAHTSDQVQAMTDVADQAVTAALRDENARLREAVENLGGELLANEAERDQLRATIERVRAEHNESGTRSVGFPRASQQQAYCTGCDQPAPCPTVRALNRRRGEEATE